MRYLRLISKKDDVMNQSKLYRDTRNQVIGGVAAGLGRYFNIDPLLVRILFVLLAIFGGGGLIIYILLWIFVPDDQNGTIYADAGPNPGNPENAEEPFRPSPSLEPGRGSLVAGLILIIIGSLFLVDRFIPHIYFEDLWPVALVVAGLALIFNHFRKEKSDKDEL